MVYRSDKPPQSKDDKNRRERERYGGIADLIMQIRQELGISVKFHAPILVNCLETITRLQEENAKLDMDIAAAKKLQRDRKQMGISGGMDGSGPFGHALAPGQGLLPNPLPLLQQNQFLSLQNAVPSALGPNKALPQIPQNGGFSMQPQQPGPVISSPAPSPGYRERREEYGGQGQGQNNGQQNPTSSMFPQSTSSFSLPGGQPPALPPHGSVSQPSASRPMPLSPDYLPQAREDRTIGQMQNHQQQSQAQNPPQEGGQYVSIIQQHQELAGPKMEYGTQVQQSVPGKLMHQNVPMVQRPGPYQQHPVKQQLPQYHSQQQNIYQINQDSTVFASPGQTTRTNSGNVNGNNLAMRQEIQQQQMPVKMENNMHQTRDLPSESRPPSSASEGFFSSFEDSNNQSMFSELNNTQPSVDLGHSETFQSDDFSLEQIFST